MTPLRAKADDAAHSLAREAANDSMAYWQKPVLRLVPKPAPQSPEAAALEQMYGYFG